jgi:RND superfamily putative drug exporter
MLGILLMGFQFVEGVAVGGAAAVFVTMLASLTLLPAMLGFVGRNIDKWHIPRLRKVETTGHQSFWFRWSRLVQRRPWITGTAALVVLLFLAFPMLSARLGLADAGSDPVTLTTRRAHDLLTEGFGAGFDSPLLLVAEVGDPQDLQSLGALSQKVATVHDVALATPPIPNDAQNPTAAIITVYPQSSSQDEATGELVKTLREDVIPPAMSGTQTNVLVGGVSGIIVDFSEANSRRLPVLVGVIILVSFLLLMVVFRSLVVPLKAAIMNLLSIGAAVGVLVAIFQWGWLGGFIGIGKPGPIEAWAPMMLFTVLFGLSMDYEVFLLSRIREEYLRTRDNGLSVANGVATTGRVITAAAAIMIAVFLSFVLGFDIRQIKLLGLGLAVAVFVDATIVRMVLVPSTMEVLGDANWWLPRWLDRILPRFKIEEEEATEDLTEPGPAPASGNGQLDEGAIAGLADDVRR